MTPHSSISSTVGLNRLRIFSRCRLLPRAAPRVDAGSRKILLFFQTSLTPRLTALVKPTCYSSFIIISRQALLTPQYLWPCLTPSFPASLKCCMEFDRITKGRNHSRVFKFTSTTRKAPLNTFSRFYIFYSVFILFLSHLIRPTALGYFSS